MENKIVLTKGNERDYITADSAVENCRQIVEINQSSTLEFSLSKSSDLWAYFEGPGLEAECNNRVYCVWGEDSVTRSRNSSGMHLPVKLKEIWYKLERQYITAYNLNIPTSSEFDHIDTHMVVLLGNSPDALYINGSKVVCPYTVGTAKYMFWCVLFGTGWTLDERYDAFWPDGVFDLETDKKSRLENINLLQSLYGGMLFWDSKNMRVALVDEIKYQAYSGYEVRYAKNLIGIERKENRDIITRLYPYGNSHLNIAAVNGGKEYIDNFDYTEEILEGIVSHNDIYTQESLLTWGKRQSAIYAKPRHIYTVDILKYDADDLAEVQPELGKLAKVIDPEISPEPTLQRALKIDQNVFVEHDCKISVGDVLNTFEGTFKDIEKNADKAGGTISSIWRIPGLYIAGPTPALTRTEQLLRSEIISMDETARSLIEQTAFEIRTEVSNVDGRVSTIKQTADSVSLEVRNARGSFSSLQLRVDSITSRVGDAEGYYSTITQSASRIALVVNSSGIRAAEIVASINGASSSVKISADHIVLTGYVTFNNLSASGQTTINGGNITTGTIDANKVNVINLSASNIKSGTLSASYITGNLNVGTITATNIVANNGITVRNSSFLVYNSSAQVDVNLTVGNITYTRYLNMAVSGGYVRVNSKRLSDVSSSDYVLTVPNKTLY